MVGDHVGGIAGLLTAPRGQWEAIEADLLTAGFVLADVPQRVTWRAVKALVAFAPRESAVFRLSGPAAQQWGSVEHLLALLADLLQTLVWMQSQDGARNRNRPKPIRRPGQVDPDRKFGTAAMTLDEAREWAAARRAGQTRMALAEEVS